MNKKIFVISFLILFLIYSIYQIDIKPKRTGQIIDDNNNPVQNIDIIYVVMDMHPTPGGATGGDSECYKLKTDEKGFFILPKTIRWDLYPLFFSEAYIEIFGGKNYGVDLILPENEFSDVQFGNNGFNKPIVFIKALKVSDQVKNLERITNLEWSIKNSGIYDFCEKEKLYEDLISEVEDDYNYLLDQEISSEDKASIYYNLGSIKLQKGVSVEEINKLWSLYLNFEPHSSIAEHLTQYEIFPNKVYSDFKFIINHCYEGDELACTPIKFNSKSY